MRPEEDFAINLLKGKYFNDDSLAYYDELEKAAGKAFRVYIHSSLDLEIKMYFN